MLAPGLCLHNLLFDLELHEFLGFDFHVLLHGCVRSLKLHCLLISDHHLQLKSDETAEQKYHEQEIQLEVMI